MNRFSTDGLVVYGDPIPRKSLEHQFALGYGQPVQTTETIVSPAAMELRHHGIGHVRSALAAVVTAFGTVVGGPGSSPIHPFWMEMVRYIHEDEDDVADFFEPVRFKWDKQQYRVRSAARKYSEETHADY